MATRAIPGTIPTTTTPYDTTIADASADLEDFLCGTVNAGDTVTWPGAGVLFRCEKPINCSKDNGYGDSVRWEGGTWIYRTLTNPYGQPDLDQAAWHLNFEEVDDVDIADGLRIHGPHATYTYDATLAFQHGVRLWRCQGVHLDNYEVRNAVSKAIGGDFVYIGGFGTDPTTDVLCENFFFNRCKRMGLGIISERNIVFRGGEFHRTGRSMIDFEANATTQINLHAWFEDIVFDNITNRTIACSANAEVGYVTFRRATTSGLFTVQITGGPAGHGGNRNHDWIFEQVDAATLNSGPFSVWAQDVDNIAGYNCTLPTKAGKPAFLFESVHGSELSGNNVGAGTLANYIDPSAIAYSGAPDPQPTVGFPWEDITPPPDPVPTPVFTYVGTDLHVAFTNLSIGATSHAWTFGDGGTSTSASPSHDYAAAGVYTVRLTETNDSGPAYIEQSVTVHEAPTAGAAGRGQKDHKNLKQHK